MDRGRLTLLGRRVEEWSYFDDAGEQVGGDREGGGSMCVCVCVDGGAGRMSVCARAREREGEGRGLWL